MATSAAASSAIPTANIGLGNYLRPRFGIYAVRGAAAGRARARRRRQSRHPADASTPPKELLEPYFFDFDGDFTARRSRSS